MPVRSPQTPLRGAHRQPRRRPIVLVSITTIDGHGGVIEAIEVEGAEAAVIGVQWEMQEGWRRDPAHSGLFQLLVEEAGRHARSREAPAAPSAEP